MLGARTNLLARPDSVKSAALEMVQFALFFVSSGRGEFRCLVEQELIRLLRHGRARVATLLWVYPDSSERLNDLTVRVRSLLANSAATGFINRIKPKSSPSAM